MDALFLTAATLTSALGRGLAANLDGLQSRREGLAPCRFPNVDLPTYTGTVEGLETAALDERHALYDCRNNRLAARALAADGFIEAVDKARAGHGADRIGLFLGTSTSGIHTAECAYRERGDDGPLPPFHYPYTQNIYATTDYVRRRLELQGPAYTLSTACSSSAKVFAAAWRHIKSGLCDAAVVGGVDSLCLTTLYGFHSLGLVSASPCRPFDARRDGISIGEAAGFVLLEKTAGPGTPALVGYGESSDGYHISAPHPEGAGAKMAMEQALARAGRKPASVAYVHAHGTGTPANDLAEDRAVADTFGEAVPCSSTKGWMGHTLGAAGIAGAVIAMLALREGFVPGTLNLGERDPRFRSRILEGNAELQGDCIMTNTFGFGGSNCSLLFAAS